MSGEPAKPPQHPAQPQVTGRSAAAVLGRWNEINSAAIAAGEVRELTLNAARSQPDLVQQPLLLLMLALYAADPNVPSLDEDISTADLYGRLLDRFARREAGKNLAHDAMADEFEQRVQDHLDRLAVAALAMFNRGRQDIGEEELGADLAALDERLMTRSRPAEAGQRIIGEFFFVHAPEARTLIGPSEPTGIQPGPGTFREPPRRAYEFLHATFGEYLVARRVMDELTEAADKMFASRRGPTEPDDDLLYALLRYQPLAVRQSTLNFAREISNSLTDKHRGQVLEVLEVLLSGYRNRHDSNRYAAYRPTAPDLVRQLACYSANLVALRATLEPDVGSVPLSVLLRASDDSLEHWRSTVLLWKASLDSDGLQAMLRTVELTGNPPSVGRSHEETFPSGESALTASEISLHRLIGDHRMERRLRFGYAACDGYGYWDGHSWADMMASWLIPSIVGIDTSIITSIIIVEPPAGTPDRDIAEIARLIFRYLRSPGRKNSTVTIGLVELIFSMPPVFDMDELAFVTAVLADSELTFAVPRLTSNQVFGRYAKLARIPRGHEQQKINFRRLPSLAIAAIQEILVDHPARQNWVDEPTLDDE